METNIEKFKTTLLNESKSLFTKIITDLFEERIYSLAFYTSGDSWNYIFPTVATENGLDVVLTQYSKNDDYKNMSKEDLKKILKWSPCDSPRHTLYADTLVQTEKEMHTISKMLDSYIDNDDEEKCEELHQQMVDACLSVLKQLELEGVFRNIDRSKFVLNLLCGDQSDEERLEHAQYLNPVKIYENYRLDLEAANCLS